MTQVTHPWDHNSHYHGLLLKQLPSRVERALDVGCGHGAFASRLAGLAIHVDAVDVDVCALDEARRLCTNHSNLKFIQGDFVALNLPTAHYDVVTSIAALHHMALFQALEQMKRVLRPGGVLAVLGLYREATISDYVASAASVLARLVYRVMHRHDISDSTKAPPEKAPTNTLKEIKVAANAVTPGARMRRHLLWRYSLIWEKPVAEER
jgi:ubiquinone/menaquinone biosynthesis C-methylase UbiE